MTKDQHNTLFGALIVLATAIVLGGIAWFIVETVDWQKLASTVAKAPGGIVMAVCGLIAFLIFVAIGKAIEPRH